MTREMLWSATLGPAPLLDRLDAAVACGYQGITVRPDDLDELAARGRRVGDVVSRARDGGVETFVVESSSRWYDHVPPPTPFPSDAYTVDDHLVAATAFGARHLSLVAPFAPAPGRAGVDALVEQFAATCDRCAGAGVTVHLEFTPFPPIPSLRTAWDIVRAADRPNGGILLDTWHFFQGEPDLDLLATIPGDRIASVQLSDGRPTFQESLVKDTFRHRLLPGHGTFDLTGALTALRSIGGLRRAGPEVLSTELNKLPPAEAARLAGEAFDRVMDG